MRPALPQPHQPVLPARAAQPGRTGPQAPHRRAVHGLPVLRLAQDRGGPGAQPQAGTAPDARDGHRRHRPGAQHQQTGHRTPGFPLSFAAYHRQLPQPQIWNSDQGSHFTSPQYTELLLGAGVQISMDGRGRCHDNIFTERLWRSVKYEEVYLTEYAHPREAQGGLSRYFPFYNHQRPHQALDYRTPAATYFG